MVIQTLRASAFVLLFFVAFCAQAHQRCDTKESALLAQVIDAGSELDPSLARSKSEELAKSFAVLSEDAEFKLTEEVTKALALLLANRDETVQMYSASSLGYFGPRAKPALPYLQAALESLRRQPKTGSGLMIASSVSAESEIVAAIRSIKGEDAP